MLLYDDETSQIFLVFSCLKKTDWNIKFSLECSLLKISLYKQNKKLYYGIVLFDCVKNYSDRSFWKKCFVKITETLFWIVLPKTLASYRDIVVIQEGFEPREFWMKLGGREKYNIDRKKVQIFYSFYSYWCLSLSSR